MSTSQRVPIYARAYPECDAQRPRLTSATVQGLPHCERTRLKKRASEGLRVATMNVGTLTERGREVVELMKMRRIGILCVQDTRWKGNRANELGEGYKFYYSAATTDERNGVGIIVSEKIKQYVTEVKREGDRLMVLRLVYGDCPINIVSTYAPQTGLLEEVKEEFWVDVERVIEGLPVEERVIVGEDLNGHIGTSGGGVERIHGGFGFRRANAEGRRVLDFAVSFDLAIANTFFCMREEHYISYKSGGNNAQIDFMMYRRSNLVEIKNCKVIPGDHVAPQHRLGVMDLNVRNPRGGNKNYEKKIRWTGLRNPEKRQKFKTKVLNRLTKTEERVQDWWENNASVLRNVAREELGETSGKSRTEREEWWWKDEIQLVLKKKELKKRWEQTRLQADRVEYQRKKKEAKRAVAVAREKTASGIYEELETVEGQKKRYRTSAM